MMGIINFLAIIGLLLYVRYLSKRIDQLSGDRQASSSPQPASTPTAALSAATQTKTSQEPAPVPVSPAEPFDSAKLVNLLPKIGVAALVIGLGFFLKYAIDQGWVSVNFRLFLGGAVGSLLLILFYLWREKYEKYALALAGGGLAVWYITVYAAVEFYSVMSVNSGFVLLVAVTLFSILLAYKTAFQAFAFMAWGGAFLVPVILGVGAHNYALLLAYLGILTIALITSVFYTTARFQFTLALCGTVFNLVAAHAAITNPADNYYVHLLSFLLINLVFHSITLVLALRKEIAGQERADHHEYALMFGLTFVVLSIPIMAISYNQFRDLAPIIMFMCGVWTLLIYALIDRLEFTKINYSLSLIAGGLLTLAVLWQFGPNAQVIMLYLLGLTGLAVGRIQRRAELRVTGLAVIVAGILGTLGVHYPELTSAFIFTDKFGLEMLGLAALAAAYHIFPRENLSEFEGNIHRALVRLIAVLLWFFVSWDLVNYFKAYGQGDQRNLSLSMWWIVYAAALTGASAVAALKPLRKMGLLLFGLVILKVFIYDLQSLETVYRIISFISLGVILLVVSFAYQRHKEQIKHYFEE